MKNQLYLHCPKCNKEEKVSLFKNNGKLVAILFPCSYLDESPYKNKELVTKLSKQEDELLSEGNLKYP